MTPEAATALRKPFPPESVGKLPKGNVMLDYVGHAAVTDRLLTVDPEWSWEPFALGPDGLPAPDREGNLWIRLTICGVTRIGVGDGKNAKERIGDAIRNAAMRFGVALDLWAKENLVEFAHALALDKDRPAERIKATPADDPFYTAPAETSKPPPPSHKPASPAQLKMIGALMTKAGMTERDGALAYVRDTVGRADVQSRSDLTSREASVVIAALQTDTGPGQEPTP